MGEAVILTPPGVYPLALLSAALLTFMPSWAGGPVTLHLAYRDLPCLRIVYHVDGGRNP